MNNFSVTYTQKVPYNYIFIVQLYINNCCCELLEWNASQVTQHYTQFATVVHVATYTCMNLFVGIYGWIYGLRVWCRVYMFTRSLHGFKRQTKRSSWVFNCFAPQKWLELCWMLLVFFFQFYRYDNLYTLQLATFQGSPSPKPCSREDIVIMRR